MGQDTWNTALRNENSLCEQVKNAVGGKALQAANSTCKTLKRSSNGKNLNHQTSRLQRQDKHGRTNRQWHCSHTTVPDITFYSCQHCPNLYSSIWWGTQTCDSVWADEPNEWKNKTQDNTANKIPPPVELCWREAWTCELVFSGLGSYHEYLAYELEVEWLSILILCMRW